jgi:hypothetical protein
MELRLGGGEDMRYVRQLVSLVAAVGLAGVAQAAPQNEEPQENQNVDPNGAAPPECCEEVPPAAQAPTYNNYYQTQQQPARRYRGKDWHRVFSPHQMSLTIGAGGAGFVQERLSGRVFPGVAYNARFTVGTRSWVAFEASYVGTVNKLIGPFSREPQVIGNGLESDLRINFWPGRVEPYAFGGVGFNTWGLHNREIDPATAAGFRDSNTLFIVPVGGGMSGYLGRHFLLDARFTYRFMFNQNFFINQIDSRTDQWTVQGNIGYAF